MGVEALEQLSGTVLAERYRLGALIGRGGMGAVFRATDLHGGSNVAVKIVLPDRLGDGDVIVPRFLREARLAARIEHPYVVRTLDFGRWGEKRDRYYLAMELVLGLPLGALADLPLPPQVAVALVCQVLEALAHVHAREILHRDIKPDNVLVVRDASGHLHVKVTDFGVAAALGDATSTRLTVEGSAIGTPAYMAPEQALAVCMPGPPLDLYPVGVVLFRLLTGRLPFDGPLTRLMFAKVTEDPPEPFARDGSPLPEALAGAIMRLLARQPEHRYSVAADALAALRPLAGEAVLDQSRWTLCGGPKTPGQTEVPTTLQAIPVPASRAIAREAAGEGQLWGRQDEMAAMERIAGQVEGGEGRVLLLSGEAGIGKSRLMEELAVRLAESGRFYVLRSAFHASAGGLESLRSAVDRLLGSAGRPCAEVEAVVREFLRRHGDDDEREAGELVAFLRPGPPGGDAAAGASQRSRQFALLLRQMRRIAAGRPLMLAVDDFDCGAEDSAAFLEYLLFEIGFEPARVLLAATTRVGPRARPFLRALARSDRFEGKGRHVLELAPLPEDVLAGGLADGCGLDAETALHTARRAGGNPLFAVQLARAGGVSTTGTLSEPSLGSGQGLPAPLRKLVEAALSEKLESTREPAELRDLLERLAILGDRVDANLLAAAVEAGAGGEALDDRLDVLLDLGVIVEEPGERGERISFAHGLTRDALLAGLSFRRARRLHRRAADVRIAVGCTEHGAIGDHLDAAGDPGAAVDHWLKAMSAENAAGNLGRGVAWGRRALASLPPSDPRQAPAAIRLGRLLLDAGELDAAEEVLWPVVERATGPGSSLRRPGSAGTPAKAPPARATSPEAMSATTALGVAAVSPGVRTVDLSSPDLDLALVAGDALGEVLENRGDGARWAALVERLGNLEDRAGPAGRRAVGRARALWFNSQGRGAEGRAAAEASLVGAEPGWETQRGAQRLAFACMGSGDPEAATAAARLGLAHASNSYLRPRALRTLTIVAGNSADGRAALAAAQEELDLVRRGGQSTRVAIALGDLGYALEAIGDVQGALRTHEDSVRAARQLGLEGPALYAEFRLLALRLRIGRPGDVDEAEIHAFASRAEAAGLELLALGRRPMVAWLRSVQGRLQDAMQILAELDWLDGFPRFHYLGECLQGIGLRMAAGAAAGDPALRGAARTVLLRASGYWERIGSPARVEQCKAALRELGG